MYRKGTRVAEDTYILGEIIKRFTNLPANIPIPHHALGFSLPKAAVHQRKITSSTRFKGSSLINLDQQSPFQCFLFAHPSILIARLFDQIDLLLLFRA